MVVICCTPRDPFFVLSFGHVWELLSTLGVSFYFPILLLYVVNLWPHFDQKADAQGLKKGFNIIYLWVQLIDKYCHLFEK
jgi:hypothetical protein